MFDFKQLTNFHFSIASILNDFLTNFFCLWYKKSLFVYILDILKVFGMVTSKFCSSYNTSPILFSVWRFLI